MFAKERFLYIVSESLGSDLYNGVIRHKKKLSLKEIQTIVKDIAKCLGFLKRYGIIHCDLKPENILIKNELSYNVKIIDFGSSSFIDGQDYDYLQTRPYRAPEIVFGCSFDFSSDIWSLGCIIYELVTSSVLFKYKTPQENVAKALSINNSNEIGIFSDGKKWSKYIHAPGLMTITEGNNSSSERILMKTIVQKDNIDFRSELVMQTGSLELADLILKCLILDPSKRIKIEEIIEHSFLKQNQK